MRSEGGGIKGEARLEVKRGSEGEGVESRLGFICLECIGVVGKVIGEGEVTEKQGSWS